MLVIIQAPTVCVATWCRLRLSCLGKGCGVSKGSGSKGGGVPKAHWGIPGSIREC